MEEWENEVLICSNCGERIDPELNKYFLYDPPRDSTYVCLCEICLEAHTHY